MRFSNLYSAFDSLFLEQIKKWWIWGFWSSPLMYAQNAVLINEFTGNNWKHVSPLYFCPLENVFPLLIFFPNLV